jgi:hypothetical protein
MGRFMTPDDFMNDTHNSAPQSWNLYAYSRNNPLRFVDPNGEKIYIGDNSPGDVAELLSRVDFMYGCSMCASVDSEGFLKIDTTGIDKKILAAMADFTDAVNSETYFAVVQVKDNDPDVAFGDNTRNGTHVEYKGKIGSADLIRLDFGDAKALSGDADAAEAFLDTLLPHEIEHGFPKPKPDTDKLGDTGPVVDAVNGMTDAQGMPRRLEYLSRSSNDTWGWTTYGKQEVSKSGKARTRTVYIRWLKSQVGGKGVN